MWPHGGLTGTGRCPNQSGGHLFGFLCFLAGNFGAGSREQAGAGAFARVGVLCGHSSAVLACFKCADRGHYNNNTINATGRDSLGLTKQHTRPTCVCVHVAEHSVDARRLKLMLAAVACFWVGKWVGMLYARGVCGYAGTMKAVVLQHHKHNSTTSTTAKPCAASIYPPAFAHPPS